MRSNFTGLIFILLLLFTAPVLAQQNTGIDTSKASYGGYVGAITVNGLNYQQIAFRGDIPIGKFGFGLDVQMLIDANGQIRKEDWDNWKAYLDKIYYIRYGRKSDPFYFRLGGLDYSYLGYSNIVNGYSNMTQYPAVKKYGGELSFYFTREDEENPGKGNKSFGMEIFGNDFKELTNTQKSMVFGSRIFFSPFWKFQIGATIAADLNEYASLPVFTTQRDLIGETNWAKLNTVFSNSQLLTNHIINSPIDTLQGTSIFNKNTARSQSAVWGLDFGIPLIEAELFKLDIYAHFSKIGFGKITAADTAHSQFDGGWGIALPGIRVVIGPNNFLTFTAEYRKASPHFLFGYYDYTYETERAVFVRSNVNGNEKVFTETKSQSLYDIKNAMNGIYVGMVFNFFGLVGVTANYQDLFAPDNQHLRSIKGELGIGQTLKKLIPLSEVKGYYYQDNVQDFKQWKTPNTIAGLTVGYNFKGAVVGLDYRWTFQDLDGSGKIDQPNETIKTIGFRTAVNF